jgi:futalosine hydrolase
MSMIPDICIMYILLAAATIFEIQPAIDFLGNTLSPHTDREDHKRAYEIEHLITGVGSVAATHSLMRHIGRRKPDLIIQAGIAGSFSNRRPDEVMVVREEILADLGVWEEGRFKTLFDLNLKSKDEFPFSNGLLINPYERLLALSGLEQVRGITVNEITTDKARIGWYQQNMGPVVESMEGGSLHYIGLQENIAFLQLRSASNYIGERDKAKWDIRAAIRHLNERLIALLQSGIF